MTNNKIKIVPSLIADIGGTNARFALAQNGQVSGEVTVLACRDYPDMASAANTFLKPIPEQKRPRLGTVAVAAPVNGDRVLLTNIDWSFSIDQLCRDLNLDALNVINDYTAIAWAVPRLKAGDRQQVGRGEARPDAPIAIIGPGSGLGVATLIPAQGGWTVLPTEGGHVTMAATTAMEDRVLDLLRHRFGHVSAERVLSGPGLVNIHSALMELNGQIPQPLSPEQISHRAMADPGSSAAAALELFFAFLGTTASNVVLSYNAGGGVYLAGGIVGNLQSSLAASGFRQRFEAKGRFSAYLSRVPTFVISHPFPALAGLAAGPLAPAGGR